ncbi:TPA: type II toxin-antitoxin system PemK/MazF family toxin [Clostridium botulinum]|nr:type II toxin-antitoxin system PemK/MazF family toxin [Clostridium botulinum]
MGFYEEIKEKEIERVPNEEIKRGRVFWAAVPFTDERPLKLFEYIENAKYTGKIKKEDILSFSGNISNIKVGRKSDEINVVTKYKRRMVLVVQNEEYNKNENYQFVYVVPLTTYGGNKYKIDNVKNNPNFPNVHYLGELTNKESVANIGDIKRIHKSLLIQTTKYKINDEKMMNAICEKIGHMMQIEKIEKCEECKYNYENYIKTKDVANK